MTIFEKRKELGERFLNKKDASIEREIVNWLNSLNVKDLIAVSFVDDKYAPAIVFAFQFLDEGVVSNAVKFAEENNLPNNIEGKAKWLVKNYGIESCI